jgi:transposase
MGDPTCTVEGCEAAVERRDMCQRHYDDQRHRHRAYGTWISQFVDAQPARDHVASLRDTGYGINAIATIAGVDRSTILALIRGHGKNPPSRTLRRDNAERILAVPVPSPNAVPTAPVVDIKVHALGSRRRLQALVAAGHSQRQIAHHLCHPRLGRYQRAQSSANTVVSAIITGRNQRIDAFTAEAVRRVFATLQLTPGTDCRARNRGLAARWPLPLDWDEDQLDNPNYICRRSPTSSDRGDRALHPDDLRDRRERVAQLSRAQLSAQQIAERLHITARTVVRDRRWNEHAS